MESVVKRWQIGLVTFIVFLTAGLIFEACKVRDVTAASPYGFYCQAVGVWVHRCENPEVVCYAKITMDSGLDCRWKETSR